MARDGGRNACPHQFQIQGLLFAGELLEQLVEHPLNLRSVDPGGSQLDGNAACPERLRFKAVARQFIGDCRKYALLRGRKLQQQWHQQPLAFYLLCRSLAENFFKQHALMGHVLIDDPEALGAYGEDEGVVHLPQRFQRRK